MSRPTAVVQCLRAQMVLCAESIIGQREAVQRANAWSPQVERECAEWAAGALKLSQRYVREVH